MTGFRVTRDELLAALQAVSPAQKKTLIPILGCALLRASPDGLSLTASDLDMTITRTFNGEAALESLVVAASLADLSAIAVEMPPALLDVDCTTAGKLVLKAGRARLSLQTMPEGDFPRDRVITYPATGVPWAPIARGLERVEWATAANEVAQPLFTGVSWRVASGALYLAATNRYQLASVTMAVPLIANCNIVVPARAIQAALRIFAPEEVVKFGTDAEVSHLGIKSDRATIVVRLLDGLFPDYDRFFAAEEQGEAVVDVAELAAATRRVATMTSSENRRVEYVFTPETCVLNVQTPDRGDATDSIAPSAWRGEPVTIGFDANLITAALASVGTSQVRLAFRGPRGAMSLHPVAPTTPEIWRAIVMPRAEMGATK